MEKHWQVLTHCLKEVFMFILKIVVAVAFLLAGGAKLAGAKPLADQFEEFGLPRKMMYLVGLLEIAGAIGFSPR